MDIFFVGIEILFVGVILVFVFNYIGLFNFNKFVQDNNVLFERLKEPDYDFLLRSKYGDKVDLNAKYQSKDCNCCVCYRNYYCNYLCT